MSFQYAGDEPSSLVLPPGRFSSLAARRASSEDLRNVLIVDDVCRGNIVTLADAGIAGAVVRSSPVIQERIAGGQAQIPGSFTLKGDGRCCSAS